MNIVNIMNFVRGVEPRNPSLDLLAPVLGQIALNKRFGFENTFLLQYDAIIDKKFSDVFLAERDEKTELGVWIEIVRPLVEKVGIAWRGRPGYDWDWHVDPGFLPSYTYEQKTLLIDELMEKFREGFRRISEERRLVASRYRLRPLHERKVRRKGVRHMP